MKTPANTSYFQYHQANPKGKKTSDCVVRAISTAIGYSYERVLTDLVTMSLKTGYSPFDKKCFDKLLNQYGWKMNPAPRVNGKRMKGWQWCGMIGKTAIALIGTHHLSCVVGGKWTDSFDCSFGAVGNYWTKI